MRNGDFVARGIAAIVLAIALVAHPAWSEGERVLKVRADLWPPFNTEPDAERPGFIVEILKRVFEGDGIKVDYAIMPWARALKEAERGAIDGVVGAARADAPGFYFPSVPQGHLVNDFIVRADSKWEFSSAASLREVKLGSVLNYTYGEHIHGGSLDDYIGAHKGKGVEVLGGETPLELAIQMLRRKRLDVVVENRVTFMAALKRLGIAETEFRVIPAVTKPQELFVAFSPKLAKGREYAEKVAEGTKRLRASGELAEILAAYGVQDWAGS